MVGVIVPWNFPMPVMAWGMAPALAAGNTVIVKPAELTPLTALRHRRAGAGGGPPRGRAPGAAGRGQRWRGGGWSSTRACARSSSPARPRSGKEIRRRARGQVKRLTLELGGKNANIVFADADLEKARRPRRTRCSTTPGRTAARGRGSWWSARCTTGSWSCSSPRSRRHGRRPARRGTEMGPLISAAHRDRSRRTPAARRSPSAAACPAGPGFWFPPTVLAPG